MSFAVLSGGDVECLMATPAGDAIRFVAPGELFKDGERWREDRECATAVLAWTLDNAPAVVAWALARGIAVRVQGADARRH